MSLDPPKRRPGRPPGDPSTRPVEVRVSLPPQVYDRVDAIARAHDVSIPEVIRRALRPPRPRE